MSWWEQRPGALGGKPLITGTRIPVATVWRYLDAGRTPAEIIEAFPGLTEAAVEAARDAYDLDVALYEVTPCPHDWSALYSDGYQECNLCGDYLEPAPWWEVRPGTMGGDPVFTGTRITIATVQALHTRGYTDEDIQGMYPELPLESIQLATRRGVRMSEETLPDENGYYRTRWGEVVDAEGCAPPHSTYGRVYIGPPVLPRNPDMHGTECASRSRQRMIDEPTPWNGCPHCGHRECHPKSPCALCQLTVRINNLESPR